DDRQHALALLINIDRSRIGDGRALADRVGGDFEPARLAILDTLSVPLLIGHDEIGVFKPALLEFDVADHHPVLIDTALADAIDRGDLHHFEAEIAQFMRGKEGTVRPAERHPRYGRLRL